MDVEERSKGAVEPAGLDLPGPSRRIRVEPLRDPAREPATAPPPSREDPARRPEPSPDRSPEPAREPDSEPLPGEPAPA